MPETILNAPLLGIGLTIFIYLVSEQISSRFSLTLLPPLVTASAILMLLINNFGVFTLDQYNIGAKFIHFLLGPATIALAVPLYKNRATLVKHYPILLIGVLIATVSGIVSIIFISKALGASEIVGLSLIPKSVTTPIAMDISKAIGGIPALTVACVIATGVFGSIIGHKLLKLVGVTNNIAIGLAMGASSHALGTSTCVKHSEVQVAIGSTAIGLVGIATAILAPILIVVCK